MLHLPFTIKAVLFDLDDTLYSREEAFYRWTSSFVHRFIPVRDEEQRLAIMQRIIFLDQRAATARPIFFTRLHQEYPVLRAMSVRSLVTLFQEELAQYIIPDAMMSAWLAELREAAIPFGVITNGSTLNQRNKLARLGIDKMTSCIFISQAVGLKKPQAAIFLKAAACLQHAPQDIVFVGDNPVTDIHGAHAVGMKTVWVPGNQTWPGELAYVADICLAKK